MMYGYKDINSHIIDHGIPKKVQNARCTISFMPPKFQHHRIDKRSAQVRLIEAAYLERKSMCTRFEVSRLTESARNGCICMTAIGKLEPCQLSYALQKAHRALHFIMPAHV